MSLIKVYIVGMDLEDDLQLKDSLKILSMEGIFLSENETSQLELNKNHPQIFIFKEFSGSCFESLRKKSGARIYGLPVIIKTANNKNVLPISTSKYPLFCTMLNGNTFSVTGMRNMDKVVELRRKILYMGGSFIEKSVKVTHLICERVGGERYRDAIAIGLSIMKPDWIDFLWNQRFSLDFDWTVDFEKWKCKPCYSLRIAFDGFDSEAVAKMSQLLEEMEGTHVTPDDPSVTHIVKKLEASVSDFSTEKSNSDIQEDKILEVDEDDDNANACCHDTSEEMTSPKKRPRYDEVVEDKNGNDYQFHLETPQIHREKIKVVKEEWFWRTLQVQYCAFEENYLIFPSDSVPSGITNQDDTFNASVGTPTGIMSPSFTVLSDTDAGTPCSITSPTESSVRRKRKRLRSDITTSFIAPDQPPKVIADISECDSTINLGGSSLDSSEDVSDAVFKNILKQISEFLATVDYKVITRRQATFIHLVETERNYVAVLLNIVKNFKEPCEDKNQAGGAILEPIEVKTIFQNFLPIFSLHRRLLRDLTQLLISWNENCLIGQVYCEHMNSFTKAYLPFINLFETSKAEIQRCEAEKPRFMAFLKIAQSKPECSRESLVQLMIRPVQRLPSTKLILADLRSRIKDNHADAIWLTQAIEGLDTVVGAIDEGKKFMDGKIAIFDLYHEIDGCPPDFISAQRTLIIKMDVFTVNEIWGQKNEPVTLMAFNDYILCAKRRSYNKLLTSNITSASTVSLRSPIASRKSLLPGQGPNKYYKYKFLRLIRYVDVTKVGDVQDAKCFALIVRDPEKNRDDTFGFTLPEDDSWPKSKLLNCLAKLAADAIHRLDYEVKLIPLQFSQLEGGGNLNTMLEKASRFATKTRHKVTRALSMSRTPNKLKRTVSQMMSPFSSAKMDEPNDFTNMDPPTTPLQSHTSTRSLLSFGSRRGDGTPKSRKPLFER